MAQGGLLALKKNNELRIKNNKCKSSEMKSKYTYLYIRMCIGSDELLKFEKIPVKTSG